MKLACDALLQEFDAILIFLTCINIIPAAPMAPPTVTTTPDMSELVVVEGEEVQLTCNTDPTEIGAEILVNNTATGSETLNITAAVRNDSGFYQCVTSDELVVDSVYLLVACKYLYSLVYTRVLTRVQLTSGCELSPIHQWMWVESTRVAIRVGGVHTVGESGLELSCERPFPSRKNE